MKHSKRWHNWRIKLIGVGFILAFGLIGYRALSLQLLDHELFEKRAQRQYQRIIQLPRQRGTIYDRNGQELALSMAVDSVYVEPHRIEDVHGTAKALARVVGLEEAADFAGNYLGQEITGIGIYLDPKIVSCIVGQLPDAVHCILLIMGILQIEHP